MSSLSLGRRVSLSLGALVSLGVPLASEATPAYIFASQDNVLFRIDTANNIINQFTLSNDVTGLDFDDNGTLWALGLDHSSPNGSFELFQVNSPFGVPSLQLVSDGISRQTNSMEWVGNTLYGIQGAPSDQPSTLVTITPGTGATAPVGATGNTGNAFGFPGFNGFQGITIDNGTMWGISTDNPGQLHTIDWSLSGGPEPTATFVAPMGSGYTTSTSGLDHDPATGELWSMVKYVAAGGVGGFNIGVFTIDKVTGDITQQYDLSALTAVRGASGVAVIPEPATLALLTIGGLALARRRRA